MVDERLKMVEKEITDILQTNGNIQFVFGHKVSHGREEIELKLKSKVIENVCPNYSDSRNDCENCAFGNGWHLVDGKCRAREEYELMTHYERLDSDPRMVREVRGDRKRAKDTIKRFKREKEVEASAEWV